MKDFADLPKDKGRDIIAEALKAAQTPATVTIDKGKDDSAGKPDDSTTVQTPVLFDGPPIPGLLADDVPTFPVEALPRWWSDWVVETASACAVRPCIAATLSLGVVATAAAYAPKERPISINDGSMRECLNLYAVAVEESGSNKSRVLRGALEPLRELAKTVAEERASTVASQMAALQSAEIQIAAKQGLLKSQAKKGDRWTGDPREELEYALEKAIAERQLLPEPSQASVIIGDITPEALAISLGANDGLCWATSEGHELFALLTGRYGNGDNMDIFLKAWDGESTIINRATKPAVEVKRPALSLAIAVQPVTVNKLGARGGDLSERGLVGRLLWGWPRTILGHRSPPSGQEVSEVVVAGYREGIRSLFAIEAGEAPMRLGSEAKRIADDFYRETEERIGAGGDLAWCRSMVSKMRSHLLRFAGLLHLADGKASSGVVDEETVKRALLLARYFLAHGIKAWRAMAEQGKSPEAKVWSVLQHRATPLPDTETTFANSHNADEADPSANSRTVYRGLTERELFDRVKGAKSDFPNMDTMRDVLSRLSAAGYVATVVRAGRGGRPPSPWVVINPLAPS